ncbi:MAG: sigma-70 family RNA polymerase sigma factor [Planctomycetes bacterium]|nr:sigma-70 family RNA polymerase sigma factor [Planctomycetota bacterium]
MSADPSPPTDLMVLVDAARRGDADAHEELARRLTPQVEAYVRLNAGPLIRGYESAADLAQSVYRQIIVGLGGFEGSSLEQFRSWLAKVVLHKIRMRHRFLIAQRRDRRRERPLAEGGGGDPETYQRLATCYATLGTPSQGASAREEVARVEAAVDRLPDDQRRVLTLACVVGLSHREIAEELGKAEPAVRKLLSRARARLALLLALDQNEG